jgi:hypothetical protein
MIEKRVVAAEEFKCSKDCERWAMLSEVVLKNGQKVMFI